MFKKILLGLAVVVVAVLGLALTQPDSFSVQRSVRIQAPPDKIYPLLADFRRWAEWSPWEHLDPAMKRTHSGAASGPGALYQWDGNDEVGAGRMEVTAAQPPTEVQIKLDFIRPFEGHNTTVFTLAPQGSATQVDWRMSGPTPFVSKLMQVFVSMDKLIGKDFESGLAKLKAVAEK